MEYHLILVLLMRFIYLASSSLVQSISAHQNLQYVFIITKTTHTHTHSVFPLYCGRVCSDGCVVCGEVNTLPHVHSTGVHHLQQFMHRSRHTCSGKIYTHTTPLIIIIQRLSLALISDFH